MSNQTKKYINNKSINKPILTKEQVSKMIADSKQKQKKQRKTRKINSTILNKAGKVGMFRALSSDPAIHAFTDVYTNPWSKLSARMPSFPVAPSQLIRTKIWASGICNSNGYGYVWGTPMYMVQNTLPAFFITDGSNPDKFSATGGIQTTSNSSFSANSFQVGNTGGWNLARCVALGIRVRYTGIAYNKSGLVYCIQNEPRTDDLLDYGVNEITARPHKVYSFANNSWHGVTRHITDPLDFQYQQFTDGDNVWVYETNDKSEISLDSYANMGVYIVAAPGAPFEVDIVGHFEIKGKNLQQTSVAMSNTKDLEKVASMSTIIRNKDNTTPDYNKTAGNESSSGGGAVNFVKDVGKDIIKSFLEI